MNDPLNNFLRSVLNWQPLRELGTPQPTSEAVNECCFRIGQQLEAEAAEAQEQERRRMEGE